MEIHYYVYGRDVTRVPQRSDISIFGNVQLSADTKAILQLTVNPSIDSHHPWEAIALT